MPKTMDLKLKTIFSCELSKTCLLLIAVFTRALEANVFRQCNLRFKPNAQIFL